jgi:hypothetical protein
MLWLSGEPLGPYWDGMGVKVCEMPRGLGAPGHNVWGLPHGWGAPSHKVCVLLHGLGCLVDQKAKSTRAPGGFGSCVGALGGRGVNSQLDISD